MADGAVQAGPELVMAACPPGGHFGVADVAVAAAHPLGLVPGGLVHQGGVGGFGCPDPLLRRGPYFLAAFAAAAAAHHLVPGVLGVGQDLIDQGQGPPGLRVGRRVGVRVGCQPCLDGGLAEVLIDSPVVYLADDRPVYGVLGEAGFAAAFSGLDGVGVRVLFPKVADRGLTEVPPGERAFFEAVPYFAFELEPVPFRHALLYPADKYRGRVDSFDAEWLVGGEKRNALVL